MSEPINNPEQQEVTPAAGGGDTFTQAQVDELLSREKAKAVAKATKGMPKEDELNAFRAWKESQQTEKEKWDNLMQERDTANSTLEAVKTELEQYKREKLLLSKGVSVDDVDYYVFKIGKLVTDEKDFETAAAEFLQSNAPVEKENKDTMVMDFTAPLSGGKVNMTKKEILGIKDTAERQKAIAENHELFGF